MVTISMGGKQVVIYDSIDDLPVKRYNVYSRMLMIDNGIGSDVSDFNQHIVRAIRFIRVKDPVSAETELINLSQLVTFVMSELSPRNLALCALIHSIDGVNCDDLTDKGLGDTLVRLGDVTQYDMTAQLEAVKKKIETELRLYFPAIFEDSQTKEYYSRLRQRTIKQLDGIINGIDVEAELEGFDNELITFSKPQIFHGTDGAEVTFNKQFENSCLLLSEVMRKDPKTASVFEFYTALEHLKEKNKAKNKANGRE